METTSEHQVRGEVIIRENAAMKKAKEESILAAKQNLEKARQSAGEDIVATGTLPKEWPGNLKKLIDVTKKDPEAESLTKALEDATPEARDKKKSDEAYDEFLENEKKDARAEGAIREKQEKTDKQAKTKRWRAFDKTQDEWKKEDKDHDDRLMAGLKEADALEKRQKSEASKKLKEDVDAAKDSGVMEPLRNLMMAGMSKEQAQSILTPSFGKEAAGQIADDAHGAAQKALVHNAIRESTEKGKNSETIGSMEFARKIQGGVSQDKTLEKQLATQIASQNLLSQIVKNTAKANGPQPPVLNK